MSFWNCFKLEKDKRAIVPSPTFEIQAKTWEKGEMDAVAIFLKVLERERGSLLSKISGDPTVEILRAKKENCST